MKRGNPRLIMACCVLALSLVAGLSMVAQPAQAWGSCYICGQAQGPCLFGYPKGAWGCTIVSDEFGYPECVLLGGICRSY